MGKDERTIQDCPECGGSGRGRCDRRDPHQSCGIYPEACPRDCPDWVNCLTCGGTGHVMGINPDDPTMKEVLDAAVELFNPQNPEGIRDVLLGIVARRRRLAREDNGK